MALKSTFGGIYVCTLMSDKQNDIEVRLGVNKKVGIKRRILLINLPLTSCHLHRPLLF